ncbi:hypothetical protein B5X24_HaOG202961 [Helicoverpa armigera]|uniref:TNase-like domain-containing protein n=1 Tax=Helicoverpa armigera TaxID=29058 RepID=A0A2W1BYF5_HELAM|nr:hypothetical protein B5X24_HaOG202961 [Helicoverpa armigera]
MSDNEGFFNNITHLLKQDYRGVNVSKFSKASTVPDHFVRKHETLQGSFVGVQHSPLRVLVDHRAPIYLPLWHSAKPPLPVKLWGIEVASMNAVNWLECVAKGQKVTLKLIARDNDDLLSSVSLHLPQHRKKTTETLDIAERLVELGFATASVPKNLKKNTIESKLAPALLSAEARAKSFRNGVWSENLPPLPAYVVFWRKGSQVTTDIVTLSAKKLAHVLLIASKGIFSGVKKLALRPFRSPPKQVQTT